MENEKDLNEILQKLESINSIYSRISDGIISRDYKYKFNDTVVKYKYTLEKIIKKDIPLKVCVVGTMKTGKSEFINSLIKEHFLTVSDIPMTKKVTVFKYNEDFKIFKVFNDKSRVEISKDEHKELCNHKYKDGFIRIDSDPDDIDYFEVHYPADILKNLNIADTPGFSSTCKEDDELTKRWIKKADCLIWLFNATSGITNVEEKLLKEVPLNNSKVIAIVNRMDLKEKPDREKILDEINKCYKFYDTLSYSALEIRNFEVLVKESGDIINKIFMDAKYSLLYGKYYNDNLNPGSLLIEDERITRELINSIKKYELNNEYAEYKYKVKSMLRDIKKDPVNIKSDVLYQKAYEVLKKESNNLIHYKRPIQDNIKVQKNEKLDCEKLRNKIIVNSVNHINLFKNSDVIKFTYEDILTNCYNQISKGKPIVIDNLISNLMFSRFVNAVLDIFSLELKDQINTVTITAILIEYIKNNIDTFFNPVFAKISVILEQENIMNDNFIPNDFNYKYNRVFFDIADSDLPSIYENFLIRFINYYFDKYILSTIDQVIETNEITHNEIIELSKYLEYQTFI